MTAAISNQRGGPMWIDNFLRASVCQRINGELEYCFWTRSKVVLRRPNDRIEDVESSSRLSETAHEYFFTRQLTRMVRGIENRVSRKLGEPVDRFEAWQATRYGPGGAFNYHFDCGHWSRETAGDRKFTILIYVKSPRRGGSTHFRDLDLSVAPAAGRLLMWRNLQDDGSRNDAMIHSSVPVEQGTKITLVTWIREHAIRQVQT
jgi:prolyl 4-hydroxylase